MSFAEYIPKVSVEIKGKKDGMGRIRKIVWKKNRNKWTGKSKEPTRREKTKSNRKSL